MIEVAYKEATSQAISRIGELAALTDKQGMICRSLLSKANVQAAELVLDWMTAFGMETAQTLDGSVRGILSGEVADAKPLLLGSHFDTVNNAGKYDGPLGIVSALAALEVLASQGFKLPFPVHLLGFSDEEGSRFQTTYLGSRSMVGELDSKTLAMEDEDGKTLAAALSSEGLSKDSTAITYQKGETHGYVELHIEQGKVLQDMGEPACAVSTIVGQSRIRFTLNGHADHAGTTPMDLRKDALAGASECILKAEQFALENKPGLLTVGKLMLDPGSSNAIPGEVTFTVDLRHPEDKLRGEIRDDLIDAFTQIVERRGLKMEYLIAQECDATPCDETLTSLLLDAVEGVTGERRCLLSGAGHDGVAMAEAAPIAMVFVRCLDGISHHPAEHVTEEDIETGIRILVDFLQRFARQENSK